MYANDQELSAFKTLLINENLEEANRIFTGKLDIFRNEIGTASDLVLQDLPRDDFATCLIPADVNQVKGQRFHEMQYVKPYASDQHSASYKNRKGSLHTLLYSVRFLQYMLKILHYSHQKKHSVQLCTIGS